MVALGTLGLNAGIFAVNEPVAVLADGDNRSVAVLSGDALDALDTLFPLGTLGTVLAVLTIGHGEVGSVAVAVGDGVSVYQAFGAGFFDGDDGNALFALRALRTLRTRFALGSLLALDALGLDAGVDAVDEPVAVLTDGDDGSVPVLSGFALDALDALFALLPLFALGAVSDGESRRVAVGIGDRVCVDEAVGRGFLN